MIQNIIKWHVRFTMMNSNEQHKAALISCIELSLMKNGNTNFNLAITKLNALYDVGIRDCYEHPEYLKIVLGEIYKDNYKSIINEIKMCLDELIDEKDISHFLQILEQ